MVVNGGDMYAIDAFGSKADGFGRQQLDRRAVVRHVQRRRHARRRRLPARCRLGVRFESRRRAPVGDRAAHDVVGIIAEADPTTLDANGGYKGYRLRFSDRTADASERSQTILTSYDNTFGSGNYSTGLRDGYYQLNIIGANVHAGSTVAGQPMAANSCGRRLDGCSVPSTRAATSATESRATTTPRSPR